MHLDLLESFPRKGSQRKLIIAFNNLRDHPFTLGDYTDQDPSLRIRQIKIVADYAVTYWLDDPVKAIMIVDIKPADH